MIKLTKKEGYTINISVRNPERLEEKAKRIARLVNELEQEFSSLQDEFELKMINDQTF